MGSKGGMTSLTPQHPGCGNGEEWIQAPQGNRRYMANPLGRVFTYSAWPVLKNFSRMGFPRGLLPGRSSKGWQPVLNRNPLKKRRELPVWGFSVALFFPHANFFQNQNFRPMGGFKIDAMAPRSVAGEFLCGGVWSSVVWENQATLRPSMEVFRVFLFEGNFLGKRNLPRTYDKNSKNARDKKVFLCCCFRCVDPPPSGDFQTGMACWIFLTLSQKPILKFSSGLAGSLIFWGCCRLRRSDVASQRVSAPRAKAQGTVDQVCPSASSNFPNFCILG